MDERSLKLKDNLNFACSCLGYDYVRYRSFCCVCAYEENKENFDNFFFYNNKHEVKSERKIGACAV